MLGAVSASVGCSSRYDHVADTRTPEASLAAEHAMFKICSSRHHSATPRRFSGIHMATKLWAKGKEQQAGG